MSTNISAHLIEVGVNMGDHGQDVTRAVEVLPEETVEHMVERLLKPRYAGDTTHFIWLVPAGLLSALGIVLYLQAKGRI